MPYSTLTPEIWSPTITSFFRAKLLAARAFSDMSGDVAQGGDQIHLPHMPNAYTFQNINVTSGALTQLVVTTTRTTLTVDQWVGASIPISDFQMAQVATKYNMRRLLAQDAGYALARTFDSALLTAATAAASTTVGDSNTALSSTVIEDAMAVMGENSVPKEELKLIVHPRPYFTGLFRSAKIYDAATFGLPNLPSGNIDVVYGIPVLKTAQIPFVSTNSFYTNFLVHPRSLAWATGAIPGMGGGAARVEFKRAAPSAGAGAKRTDLEVDLMYGLTGWRTEGLVAIRSTG